MNIKDLFDKYRASVGHSDDEGLTVSMELLPYVDEDGFVEALAEHDKEIVSLIDEMIEERKLKHPNSDWESEIITLTELKQKIQ